MAEIHESTLAAMQQCHDRLTAYNLAWSIHQLRADNPDGARAERDMLSRIWTIVCERVSPNIFGEFGLEDLREVGDLITAYDWQYLPGKDLDTIGNNANTLRKRLDTALGFAAFANDPIAKVLGMTVKHRVSEELLTLASMIGLEHAKTTV